MDPEIRLQGRNFDFTVPLGEGEPDVTAGGAVITETPVPQGAALTEYEGDELLRVDVPVFFDGWPRRSVQSDVDQIVGLCFGSKGALPSFKASGPMPFSGWRFQMDGLPDFLSDPPPQRTPGGSLVRRALLMHLVEFNDPDSITYRKHFNSHEEGRGIGQAVALGGVSPAIPVSITLPNPATLLQVAARVLHDVDKAADIGKLNGIRDTRQLLPAGTHLRLPTEG